MVKVQAVKPAKSAKAKAPKVVTPPPPPLACSPSTRSNEATVKDNINIKFRSQNTVSRLGKLRTTLSPKLGEKPTLFEGRVSTMIRLMTSRTS